MKKMMMMVNVYKIKRNLLDDDDLEQRMLTYSLKWKPYEYMFLSQTLITHHIKNVPRLICLLI